jgi:sulfur-carrier protein
VPVTFHIPGALREFTAGHSKVEIENSPTTLAEALSALWTLYPGVRDRIATEQGQVREHINIFIADENVRYTVDSNGHRHQPPLSEAGATG